jgi:hypothetical protein
MMRIYGEFVEPLPPSGEELSISFFPDPTAIASQWRSQPLSADVLADYLNRFFTDSSGDRDLCAKRAEIQCAVSYIANELLENAIKFHHRDSVQPISIQVRVRGDRLIFLVSNSIDRFKMERFQEFIEKTLASDPHELYIHQVEKNAADESNNSSGLGYLTIMVDYMARIGWKFETLPNDSPFIRVTTMVQLFL